MDTLTSWSDAPAGVLNECGRWAPDMTVRSRVLGGVLFWRFRVEPRLYKELRFGRVADAW
jgi:hypothetical protein